MVDNGTHAKKFICTRISLAYELMKNGIQGEMIPNPWTPEYAAWSYDRTPELTAVVERYYEKFDTCSYSSH